MIHPESISLTPSQEGFFNSHSDSSNQGMSLSYILKNLRIPSSFKWNKKVLLICDPSGGPYLHSDFIDPLKKIIDLKNIHQLGSQVYNYVFLLGFKDDESANSLLRHKEFRVKNSLCKVIRPMNKIIHATIHWLDADIQSDIIAKTFANYGKVLSIEHVKSRVPGLEHVLTNRRSLRLEIKDGLKLEDLPYSILVNGLRGLVTITGRSPLCYRCRTIGHIRSECKGIKCSSCKKFHKEDECCNVNAPTFAEIISPTVVTSWSDMMDQDNLEDVLNCSPTIDQLPLQVNNSLTTHHPVIIKLNTPTSELSEKRVIAGVETPSSVSLENESNLNSRCKRKYSSVPTDKKNKLRAKGNSILSNQASASFPTLNLNSSSETTLIQRHDSLVCDPPYDHSGGLAAAANFNVSISDPQETSNISSNGDLLNSTDCN